VVAIHTGLRRGELLGLYPEGTRSPDGRLYLSQASMNAMGAPDAAWGMRPEHLLSASILRVDVNAIAATRPACRCANRTVARPPMLCPICAVDSGDRAKWSYSRARSST